MNQATDKRQPAVRVPGGIQFFRGRNLKRARQAHEEDGGVLLVEGDEYVVGLPDGRIGAVATWCGRSGDYLDALAPSWDETHPDNAKGDVPAQVELSF